MFTTYTTMTSVPIHRIKTVGPYVVSSYLSGNEIHVKCSKAEHTIWFKAFPSDQIKEAADCYNEMVLAIRIEYTLKQKSK